MSRKLGEEEMLQSLHDQPSTLSIFTAQEVSRLFLPYQTHTVGRKKRRAATRPLKYLADTDVLFRREMHEEDIISMINAHLKLQDSAMQRLMCLSREN